ncbi:MAG TPA: hypothetical protein VNU70_11055 [Puia sp.]|nr:hypothetical protein [Puia sp.]
MQKPLTYPFICLSLIIFTFGSCKKSQDASSQDSQQASSQGSSKIRTTFSFTRNDIFIDWSSNTNAIVFKPLTNAVGTFYRLLGTSDSSTCAIKGTLNIRIPQSTVIVGSWTSDIFVEESYMRNTNDYFHQNNNYEAKDDETITITSVHDGMVDGTFQLSMTNSNPNTLITNGVFYNVKIADQ